MATVPPKQIQSNRFSAHIGRPMTVATVVPPQTDSVLWRATERPPAVAKPFPPNRFPHDFHILVFRNFTSEIRTGYK